MRRTPRAPQVKVVVTPEIIDATIARDSTHCMIADAVRASFPDAKAVSVDLATIRFTDPKRGLRYTYLTPRIAQVELVKFDQGMKPSAFDFRLRNGQVTRSGSHKSTLSTAEHEQRKAAGLKGVEKAKAMKRQRLVNRNHRDGREGAVPDRVGGKTPPLQAGADKVPFSRRRAFGLRALAL